MRSSEHRIRIVGRPGVTFDLYLLYLLAVNLSNSNRGRLSRHLPLFRSLSVLPAGLPEAWQAMNALTPVCFQLISCLFLSGLSARLQSTSSSSLRSASPWFGIVVLINPTFSHHRRLQYNCVAMGISRCLPRDAMDGMPRLCFALCGRRCVQHEVRRRRDGTVRVEETKRRQTRRRCSTLNLTVVGRQTDRQLSIRRHDG